MTHSRLHAGLALLGMGLGLAAAASAQVHTQPIPDHGISAPQVEDWIDAHVRNAMLEQDIPGLTIAASHEGRIVYSKGFGYRDIGTATPGVWLPMQRWTRSRIGSNSKLLTTAAMMKLIEEQPQVIDLRTRVYGTDGILHEHFWWSAQRQGARRHNPIADMAIGKNGRVTTWYRDGKYTQGTPADLDRYRGATTYRVPSGQTYDTLVATARGAGNDVWSWYRDGTVAMGTPEDLGRHQVWDEAESSTSGGTSEILAIAMDKGSYTTFTWYHDGRVAVGTPFLLDANAVTTFTLDTPQDRYDIVGIARRPNGTTVAWLSDGTAIQGVQTKLDAIGQPFAYDYRTVPGSIARWQDWRRMTEVRHLLSHTSGMDRSGNWAQAVAKYPQADGTRDYQWSHRYVLSTAPRLFEPGTSSSYSNHGLGLTGYLIERVTGQYFDEYIGEKILEPIGLYDLVPHWSEPFDAQIDSVEYQRDANEALVPVDKHDYSSPKSAAGAYTGSAQDVLKFLLAIDGRSNRPDVLTPGSITAMRTRPFPSTAPTRGLGWQIDCNVTSCIRFGNVGYRLRHDGATGGAKAWMVRFENYQVPGGQVLDDIQVVINTNTGDVSASDLDDLATEVARIIELVGTGSFDQGDG